MEIYIEGMVGGRYGLLCFVKHKNDIHASVACSRRYKLFDFWLRFRAHVFLMDYLNGANKMHIQMKKGYGGCNP